MLSGEAIREDIAQNNKSERGKITIQTKLKT
jgi:hypothetical protein